MSYGRMPIPLGVTREINDLCLLVEYLSRLMLLGILMYYPSHLVLQEKILMWITHPAWCYWDFNDMPFGRLPIPLGLLGEKLMSLGGMPISVEC